MSLSTPTNFRTIQMKNVQTQFSYSIYKSLDNISFLITIWDIIDEWLHNEHASTTIKFGVSKNQVVIVSG